MIGSFMRYADEAHRDVLEAWPELEPILFRPSYEDASRAAKELVEESWRQYKVGKRLSDRGLDIRESAAQWIHKTPDPLSGDPLDAVGSWGWKVTDTQSEGAQ